MAVDTIDPIKKAAAKGIEAGMADIGAHKNPYTIDTDEWKTWMLYYDVGYEESRQLRKRLVYEAFQTIGS